MSRMILLNETGDITIAWKEDKDDKMREMIQRKLDQGYSFFIVEPKLMGLWKKKTKLLHVDQLQGKREIHIKDEDAQALFDLGDVLVGNTPHGDLEVVKRTENVEEIAKSDTLALRPIKAG